MSNEPTLRQAIYKPSLVEASTHEILEELHRRTRLAEQGKCIACGRYRDADIQRCRNTQQHMLALTIEEAIALDLEAKHGQA